jgi:lysophospholipase L1-like esterase
METLRKLARQVTAMGVGAFALLLMLSANSRATAQIRVACVGDSITYGVAVSNQATTSYPADLQNSLGSGYNVQNFGYPGLALMNLPQGNPSSHPAYTSTSQYTSMVAFNPNIIIVILGTNDASFPVDASGWSTDYLSTFTSQYESFITSLRNQPAKPTVYIATLPEVYGTNQYGIDPTIANTIITPAIHTIAAATGAPLIDIHTATVSTGAYSGDNVHPNDQGTTFLANTVYTALEPPLATNINYQIVDSTSGMCVTDTNASTSSGTPLEQVTCGTNQTSQQWTLKSTGNGSFSVTSVNAPSLAWDDTSSSTANSTLIQLLTSSNTTDEEWLATQQPNKDWTFTNLTSGRCLDDTNGSTTSGTQFQQYACAENTNQEFSLVQAGTAPPSPPTAPSNLTATATSNSQINLSWTASSTSGVTYSVFRSTTNGFTPAAANSISTGLTVTSYADIGLTASTTYYYRVEAVNSNGSSPATSQASAATSSASGGGTISTTAYYQIVNEASGSCIDDTSGSAANGTVLQQYTCYSGNLNQEWLFTATSGGYYEVTTYNSTTAAWNVVNVGTAPGTGMQLWQYGGGANEQFEPILLSTGYYEFKDRNSGLCLYVPNDNNNQQLQINTCNGSTSESFKLNEL